ncbi:MAG: T9SS type A sorting domain-containing protein [bacterium]|nr:T9SS type A sorting domain-containing protein [bacterium]
MLRRATMVTLLCLSLCLVVSPAFAEWDVDGLEELLPRHETEAERRLWLGREDEMPTRGHRADAPPLAPIRNCAEWEPATGVIVRYPLGLPYSLLTDLDDDLMLHVVVSSGYQSQAQSNLSGNGVNMDKVQFLVKSNDSIWTRDYGPWYVFDGNGDIAIIDHTYNRSYRPNDNLIPVHFAQQQGIPVHSHDMYHTGGNYMTDGAHISSSTRLVYDEAGMSSAQVDQLMHDYYGVEDYKVLDYIENGGIHHIDTWAKFLNEETVLVKDVWSSHHTYDDLNQRATLLASLPASTGRNYRVHRVYCYDIGYGDPASYTNSLICNGKVYMPTFGNSSHDNNALDAYRAALPGYEVEGYYHSGFLSDDALHCRTKIAHDTGMLRVAHTPIFDSQEGEVTVSAHIRDHSETGVSLAEVRYRRDGGAWQALTMAAQGDYVWEAVIPAGTAENTVEYYIHAEDNSGRDAGMPRVAPDALYSFMQSGTTGIDDMAPSQAVLNANYPNPFNPETTFSFELHHEGQVRLSVYDTQGRIVRTLINGTCPAGRTSITWNGKDDAGRTLSSGVYLYRLHAAGLVYTRPATLVK